MLLLGSCTKDDSVRLPEDIIGIWSPSDTTYLEFSEENTVYHLEIRYQDSESIGEWTRDVYYYEPGYNLVVYLSSEHDAAVYQIVELTQNSFTWCWVKDIDAESTESITQIIGQIINEAQEGFKLDPALFRTFHKIPRDQFYKILENLDINYPF